MALYQKWADMLEKLSREAANEYFEKYYETEMHAYEQILENKENVVKGTVAELAERFSFDNRAFSGFCDGINTSLNKELDVKGLEADTEVELDINWEKLYYNMHGAKADWLYTLPQWDGILTEEKRAEIAREYRDSLQAHVEHVGRNDPCPCGSGKKYKKCCGKNEA